MWEALKAVLKQPFWVPVFVAGVILAALPSLTFDKDHWISVHEPKSWLIMALGGCLIVIAIAIYLFDQISSRPPQVAATAGLDTSRVDETSGIFSIKVNDCQIRVLYGRLEAYAPEQEAVFVLPCNEYFDRSCTLDPKGALGAYIAAKLAGRSDQFAQRLELQAQQRLGTGQQQTKLHGETAISFGAGRALLLNEVEHDHRIALVSTTTQRAGEGLISRISYLFEGLRDLAASLSDAPRVKEVVMPVLGAGHGGIAAPLALVGLLLSIAEVVRYSPRAQSLKKVTVVIFRKDSDSPPDIDPVVVRRALALIA